jgi:hypothetical protein
VTAAIPGGIDPSRIRTLMVDGQQPVVGGGIPGLIPLHATPGQSGPMPVQQPPMQAPMPTEASAKPTMMAFGPQSPAVPDSSAAKTYVLQQPPLAAPPAQHAHAYAQPGAPHQEKTLENPLANPEYLAAAAAFNASEEKRKRMEQVVGLPAPEAVPGIAVPKQASGLWILVVLLLCAGAAVGGFFLVDALM